MDEDQLIQICAFPGWIVRVSYTQPLGYHCWVVTPELIVLNDGESYSTSAEAMDAGRCLVHHSLEVGTEEGG